MATPSKNKQLADLYSSLGQLSKSFQTAAASLDVESTKFVDAITRTSDAFKKVIGGKVLSPLVSASKSITDAFEKATNNINQGGEGGEGGGGGGGGGRRRDEDDDNFYFFISNVKLMSDAFIGSLDFASRALFNFTTIVGPLTDVVQIHQGLMNKLNTSIADIPQQFEVLQQQLLGLGTNIPKFESTFASELKGLIGDEIQNMSNAANLVSQGLRGNFKGLLQVAAKMDLTGQKSSLLTNEFVKFAITMQSNGAQMNSMALALQHNAETYSVKTEDLIKVIGGIKSMDVMGALGFGPQFTSNLTSLASEFKIGQDQITGLINSLTNPETFAKIAAVDPALAGLVSQLERSSGPEQFKSVFTDIVTKLGSFAQGLGSQAQGTGLPSTIIGSQLFAMFGPALLQASQMLRILTGDLTEQQKVAQRELDITNSFNAVVLELKNQFRPLLEGILSFSKSIMEGKGAYFLLGGIVLKLTTNIVSGILTMTQFYLTVNKATNALTKKLLAIEAERVKSMDPLMGGKGRGVAGMFAAALTSPLIKITMILTVIGGIVSAVSLLIPLFSKQKDSTEKQINSTNQNTAQLAALTNVQSQQNAVKADRELSMRNSFYAGMNRALASTVTGEKVFVDILQQLKTQTTLSQQQYEAFVKSRVEEAAMRVINSPTSRRP